MTQFIGLVGYPLKHSVSPQFQQAALDYYRLDINYEALETKAESLSSVIDQLRQPQNLGANITVPYKEAVIPLVDEIDSLANLIGAVNTIVNRDGRLIGFNTDACGFLHALKKNAKFDPAGRCAAILGAGGVARAVSFALLHEKVETLVIINRTLARAVTMAESLTKHATERRIRTEITALPWQNSKLDKVLEHCHLIVNCTSLGTKHGVREEQSPLTVNLIPRDALVYDLVYNPSKTLLMKTAEEAGAETIGGLPMLIYQGAASFKIWTGREAPVDIMFAAALRSLLGD